MLREYVLHVDGDCFFASCEVARKPELWGRPVVVGEERGIATALTYEAKKLGVKRGDPIFKIRNEFKEVTILTSHFELYNYYCKSLIRILKANCDCVESYSIDECFVTIFANDNDDHIEIKNKVRDLKDEIQMKLGITYSFGVSYNKTLAKVASKKNKPNGLFFLLHNEDIKNTLINTKIESIWGIGQATSEKLNDNKIFNAYDFSLCDLKKTLGTSCTKPILITQDELKSIKHLKVANISSDQKTLQSTRTFINKTNDIKIILSELSKNVEVACSQLRIKKLYTNKIHYFLKSESGNLIEHILMLKFYTQSPSKILKVLEEHLQIRINSNKKYKSCGVTLINLIIKNSIEQDLFQEQEYQINSEEKIFKAIGDIRNKFGFKSIMLASSKDSFGRRSIEQDKRNSTDNYEYNLPLPFLGIINA